MLQFRPFVFILFLLIFNCANIYSPSGIKGDKAKKEIKYLMDSLGLIPARTLFSPASYRCQVDSSAILGSSNANTPSNFSLLSFTTKDLNASAGGTLFFRSTSNNQIKSFNLKLLRTANTESTADCSVSISANACMDPISTGTPLTNDGQVVVPFGECLAIMCTAPAYIRVQDLTVVTNRVTPSPEVVAINTWIVAPEVFRNISKIDDNIYYTNESFNKCKKGIVEVSALDSSAAFARANNYFEVSYCNKVQTASSVSDANTAAILQGNECHLEPVNALGF